jgi:8-oxo-dGTP pyrophosphatase MutT (NUDIX family)
MMQANRFAPLLLLTDEHESNVPTLHGSIETPAGSSSDESRGRTVRTTSDPLPGSGGRDVGSDRPLAAPSASLPTSMPTSPRAPQVYADRIPLPFRSEAEKQEFAALVSRVPLVPTSKRWRYSNPVRIMSANAINESYAIVLISYARGDDAPAVLLGHRRETVELANFVRGLYEPRELYAILSLMSVDERRRVLEHDFNTLWNDYWPLNASMFHRSKARSVAEAAYGLVKPYLRRMLELTRSSLQDTEWLFPRGRAKRRSRGEVIAIEEFEEETRLSLRHARRAPIEPYRELYYGSDDQQYATTHYVYVTDVEALPAKREAPVLRQWMVSNDFDTVGWFPLDQVKQKLNEQRYRMIESFVDALASMPCHAMDGRDGRDGREEERERERERERTVPVPPSRRHAQPGAFAHKS